MKSMLMLLSDYEEPMIITDSEWINMERVMNCITLKLKHLKKAAITFENRINFFKRNLKICQARSLQEAHQIVNRLCKEDDIIDCEIKCYLLDFLYNISYL